MDEEQHYRRFEDYARQGWLPHSEYRSYTCGWCGTVVSSDVGLVTCEDMNLAEWAPRAHFKREDMDVRVCPECCRATTFDSGKYQLPSPLQGESFDTKGESDDVKTIVALYNEARNALSQGAPSCAVLMFRKILMHVAVQKGAPKGKSFAEHVEYLKDQGIVGKPLHDLVERIRKDGNQENHELVRAEQKETAELLSLVTLLLQSVYFVG